MNILELDILKQQETDLNCDVAKYKMLCNFKIDEINNLVISIKYASTEYLSNNLIKQLEACKNELADLTLQYNNSIDLAHKKSIEIVEFLKRLEKNKGEM